MRGPQNIHVMTPNARNGPYGTAVMPPSFALPRRMRTPPAKAPTNDETTTVHAGDAFFDEMKAYKRDTWVYRQH